MDYRTEERAERALLAAYIARLCSLCPQWKVALLRAGVVPFRDWPYVQAGPGNTSVCYAVNGYLAVAPIELGCKQPAARDGEAVSHEVHSDAHIGEVAICAPRDCVLRDHSARARRVGDIPGVARFAFRTPSGKCFRLLCALSAEAVCSNEAGSALSASGRVAGADRVGQLCHSGSDQFARSLAVQIPILCRGWLVLVHGSSLSGYRSAANW